MAQSKFTREEAEASEATLKEVMEAFPKRRVVEFIGHFNDLFLFLAAAKNVAPKEKK